MDKVKEKAPASGGAEPSTSNYAKLYYNKSIASIGGNVKREVENSRELREAM